MSRMSSKRVPDYIKRDLKKAVLAAERYSDIDYRVSKWFDLHGIECEFNHLHSESIVNPMTVFEERMKLLNMYERGEIGND